MLWSIVSSHAISASHSTSSTDGIRLSPWPGIRSSAGAPAELAIRGGTIVTSGSREIADLGIRDGRIAQIGGTVTAERELDAAGLLVMPGGIDMHVHLTQVELEEGGAGWVDNFTSG